MIESQSENSSSKTLMLSWKEHALFWFLTIVFYSITVLVADIPLKRALFTKLFFLPFQLVGAYVIIFFILGKLLYRNKYLKAIFSFVVFIFVYAFIVYYVHDYYFRTAFVEGFTPPSIMEMLANFEVLIIYYMNSALTIPLILVCIEFAIYHYNRIKEVEQLQIRKNEAELNLLKTQIHPNFLLSTLRNLEVLSKNESEKSPLVVEKLSEVLDYILYKGQQERVALKDEVNAIKDFVELESIRFDGKCKIELRSSILNGETIVSPLILFSFLEYNFNQFNQSNIPFRNCLIELDQFDDKLFVQMTNSNYNPNINYDYYEIEKMSRQLEISYPGMYTLDELRDSENYFKIKLEILL